MKNLTEKDHEELKDILKRSFEYGVLQNTEGIQKTYIELVFFIVSRMNRDEK